MAKKEREFKQLNDREHILVRPNIYIGAVDKNTFNDYFFDGNNNVTYQEVEYVQGFVKIINEVIDNSVDEAIRTKFEYGNRIKVTFNDENRSIIIEDNGRGIPVKKNSDDLYFPVLCWGYAKSGENFSNDENRETIGLNGVGSYCCNVFSKSFVGETCDGESKFIGTWTENAENFEHSVRKNSSKGTKVEFVPDLKRFSLKISDVFSKDSLYKKIIKQRLFNLSICFPKIAFVFDGKQVKTGNSKSIFSMFGDDFEHINNDNCMFAVYPNMDDNFRFYSYINGLHLPNGGVHIDVISNEITSIIRDKLGKKFKGIKPGEIKNKLFIVFYGLNFPSPKFDSQTKEKLTNSAREIKTYLEGIDLEKFANKILKNSSIIDPIVEIYKIKEEFKRKQEIGTLNKKPKNVKDKKYLPPIGLNKYIFLAEGECLDKDTEVFIFNENENVKLKDVNIGDCVLTHKQNVKQITGKTTTIKDCFKIKTKSGKEIICSEEHRFFVYDGDTDTYKWKKLKNIDVEKDKLVSNKLNMMYMVKITSIDKSNNAKYPLIIKCEHENYEINSSLKHAFTVYNIKNDCFEYVTCENLNIDDHLLVFLPEE